MVRKEKKYRYYVHKYEGKVTRIARLGSDGAFGWDGFRWVEIPGLWKIEWDVTADYDSITKDEAERLIADERARTEYYGCLGIDTYDTVVMIVDEEAYVYRVPEKMFRRDNYFLKAKYDLGSEFEPITEEEARTIIERIERKTGK